MILCYELSDQQALTLHQVKAHDVRAFAASNCAMLPLGGLFLGTELIPLFPNLRAGMEKGGGQCLYTSGYPDAGIRP